MVRKYICTVAKRASFFFFFRWGTSGFLTASVKREDQMLIWLPSSAETGEIWREKGTKTLFVFTWGVLARVIITFMKVHGKKVEEAHRKKGETGEENYFSPLPSLYAPFNKRWDGNGWRRPSSGGILGLLWARRTRTPERIQPFLCFSHSLRHQTFDHPTMTGLLPHYVVHLDEKLWGQRHKQQAEQKWRPDHLNRSLLQDPRALNNTKENILSFNQVFFSISLPFFSVLFSIIWSSLGSRAHIAHTALSVWMQLII